MNEKFIIEGIAAPLPIANLDTDQIMPKQFLRGIDKAGLDRGVLHDLRFDGNGQPRPDFVLQQPPHRVQFGVRAIVASSFGEIFYSNAMNNGLMLATVPEEDMQRLLAAATASAAPMQVRIDVDQLEVCSSLGEIGFTLSERHRRMFMDGLDMLGASLVHLQAIEAFAQRWHVANPWLKDVALAARTRLDGQSTTPLR